MSADDDGTGAVGWAMLAEFVLLVVLTTVVGHALLWWAHGLGV